MDRLEAALAGMAWHPVPEGVVPKTSKLCRAIKANGVPLPRAALWAANSATQAEADGMREEDRAAYVRARAVEQRQARQDRWAEEGGWR